MNVAPFAMQKKGKTKNEALDETEKEQGNHPFRSEYYWLASNLVRVVDAIDAIGDRRDARVGVW